MSRKKAWRLAGLNRLLKRDSHPLSLLSLVRGEMFCCKFRRTLHCGLWSAGGEWGVSLKSSSCHEAAWAWARNWELRGSHRVQRGEGAGLTHAASPSQVRSLFSQPGAVFSLCRKSGLVASFSYLLSRFISLTDFTQELLPVVRRQPGGDFYVILGNLDVSCCSSWTPFNNV